MKTSALTATLAVVLATPLGAQDAAPDAGSQFAVALDDLQYGTSPISDLIESAVVYGDPAEPGLYTTHARVREGAVVPPHTHPNTLTTVVTSGTAYVGVGEAFDEATLVAYPEGSVFVTEADVPHFIAAPEGDFSILDHGAGPSGIAWIPQTD